MRDTHSYHKMTPMSEIKYNLLYKIHHPKKMPCWLSGKTPTVCPAWKVNSTIEDYSQVWSIFLL